MSQAITDWDIGEYPHCITEDDNAYPERIKFVMGKKSPHELHFQGNMDLLNFPSLGIAGSRKASEKGLNITADCARQAAQHNIVVVSGNATGVDFEAHYNSLKAGGKTIFVLPEGMGHFRVKKNLRDVWDWNNVLVVSQFPHDAVWRGYRAMERNKVIIALSRALIVIEAGATGGTLDAGETMLKYEFPLFVADYADAPEEAKGNKILLDRKAKRLTKSRSTNSVFFTPVADEVCKDFIFNSSPRQWDMKV